MVVGVGSGVDVGSAVSVGVDVAVGVGVAMAVAVAVAVSVGEGTGVSVGTTVTSIRFFASAPEFPYPIGAAQLVSAIANTTSDKIFRPKSAPHAESTLFA